MLLNRHTSPPLPRTQAERPFGRGIQFPAFMLPLLLLAAFLLPLFLLTGCSSTGGDTEAGIGKRVPCPYRDLKVPCYWGPDDRLYKTYP